MRTFQLFPPAILPPGFCYPAALCALARDGEPRNIFPWAFLDAATEIGELAYLMRCHDGRNLVPFASVSDERKDIACFDADDLSGDPPVRMLFATDRGPRHAFSSFSAWQAAAVEDAARWRLGRLKGLRQAGTKWDGKNTRGTR